MPKAASEDPVLRVLRAAATGPRQGQTSGALAAHAGLSYGAARRAVAEASAAGWLALAEADICMGRQLRWRITDAGLRRLAEVLSGRAG
jgi:hypothetical protein